jgi:PhnB protein
MPKRSPAEQLDQAISALLSTSQPPPEANSHPSIAALVSLVPSLRSMPRPEFKAALKSELQRRISMKEATVPSPAPAKAVQFRRANFPNIAPYFLVEGAPRFIDFLVAAFEGTERIRVPRPDGSIMHAEVAIGNSVIELGDANEQYPQRQMTTHLYVPDADATFARALQAGAASLYAPTDDHPSGDRWGALKDQFGNNWYIAKPRDWTPGPEGLRSVQPYLHLRGADKMIPFMEAAFGAETIGLHKSPEGIVHHATIRIGNATLEIDESHGEYQPKPCHLHVYVPDTDAIYAQALRAGATPIEPPRDAPYGDRAAGVKDMFGNSWFIATYKGMK